MISTFVLFLKKNTKKRKKTIPFLCLDHIGNGSHLGSESLFFLSLPAQISLQLIYPPQAFPTLPPRLFSFPSIPFPLTLVKFWHFNNELSTLAPPIVTFPVVKVLVQGILQARILE